MHQNIDRDAAHLLAAHTYRHDGLNYQRDMKPRSERADQYLNKDTVITSAQLTDHGLANRQRRQALSPSERDRALRWLRDLIAKQA